MINMDKCGTECEVYSQTFNRCSYEEEIRADERAKIIDIIISTAYESKSGFLTVRKGFLEDLKEANND